MVGRVLDGLLGEAAGVDWTDPRLVLAATGRLPLPESDRALLGDRARRLPLLG